jgi:hypothetical protein
MSERSKWKASEMDTSQRQVNEAFVEALNNLGPFKVGPVATACVKVIAAMFILSLKKAPATDNMIEQFCDQVTLRNCGLRSKRE